MALHADQLSVLASVAAQGEAGENGSGEDEEAEAPEDGHTADFLPGDVSGVSTAGGAGRATSTIIIANSDDGGSGSRSRRSVHRGGGHGLTIHGGGGHGLTIHGGRLSVH